MSACLGLAMTAGALYGAFSGVFIARAARLWRLSRYPHLAVVAAETPRAGRSVLRRLVLVALGAGALFAGTLAALIAFCTSSPPPPLLAVSGAVMARGYQDLPPLERFTARDGAALAYRAYQARVAVMVHGSSGGSHAMHGVGLALAKSGTTAYAMDMRGHVASGRRGDIDYVG